jgi:hypothetical protein
MRIKSPAHLVAVLEQARIEQGLSMRQLSTRAGKSPPAYHFWKKLNADKDEFDAPTEYAKALGLKLTIKQFVRDTND